MRTTFSLLALFAVAATLGCGCANYGSNVERKFGRGVANTAEIFRGGEFRRSVEQTSLFEGPDTGASFGFVRGVNRTLGRTGIGIYEVVTAPLPPFHPVATDHFAPGPVYPDNYQPGMMADSMFTTDSEVGFGGGDVLPMVPGSRFRIFDTH